MPESVHLRFDRGTLRLDGAAADKLPTVVWDERVSGWRAPAYRYASIVDRARAVGADVRDEIAPRIAVSSGRWTMPELRTYQRDALRSWRAFRNRGVVVRAKRLLLATLVARHRDDRSLIFTASTDDAYDIALEHLVPVLTSETTRRERHALLERYRDGRYRTLVSARVLNEGVDVPEARVAIIVAGRFGAREHIQRIGRVLRPAPGKVATLYELVTSGAGPPA